MSETWSFQDIILRLIDYWKAQGCVVQQPYNVQVGAGTMNPATALRVLGPEPWNVVYVEPSIRPDDGRFGDNPNRMQMHHQLQVILKPDPGNPQELYLKSLEAIGIDARQHDIRFVEDNWESPALGAWGLGWEVWLDGQEITQFTYFQQAGGLNLDPVSVEITYGLDRITLALQKKRSVWEIDYGAGIPYGDVLLQSEIEHCLYYFNVADVEALRQVYDIYEREAQRCLDNKLILPAHDYNLKCSHLFNVLDTRGAIGVTERANYFKRMRALARQVSEQYLEQRQRLEYPLLEHARWATIGRTQPVPAALPAAPNSPQTFLLEIGVEELPVGDLMSVLAQLRVLMADLLADLRLSYDRLEVDGAPRRQAIWVHGLAPYQSDLETEAKGPPADRAFDADGQPTRAALGFAQSKGVPLEALTIIEQGGKRYVAAVVREVGRPAAEVLAEALPGLLGKLRFEKSMRWNASNVAFSRPLRWLVALLGRDIIPFTYAGVQSGRVSRGLRPYDSPDLSLAQADDYAEVMRDNHIVWRMAEREQIIRQGAAALAASQAGTLPDDSDLLAEVTNLVESPTPFIGRFEARYLALPPAILVAVMRKHQRYFPLYAPNGRGLLPFFVAVRNGDALHLDSVTDGNEQVIRARFADAEFFYNNDRKRPLTAYVDDLATLTFQADLGSMRDKTERLEQLTPLVAQQLGLDAAASATATRAAALAKADLATAMVVEMTSLQGIMGGHYASLSGESAETCAAIAEQYQAVSRTQPGLALALADRLDSLVGLTAVGLLPKGSNDPFALRRAAIHIIENLIANTMRFDLRAACQAAADVQPVPVNKAALTATLAFIAGRLEGVLRDRGFRASVVKAVLAEQSHDPYAAWLSAEALSQAIQLPDWPTLLDAYARCVRITRALTERYSLQPETFGMAAEQGLYAAYMAARDSADGSLPTLIDNLRRLEPAITRFFEDVLVMDEDLAVRANRLALLQHIADLARGLADLSELEGF